jgi:uncharacterized repeat protein (TIGR03803 family)
VSLVVVGTSGATTGAVSFSVLHSFSGPEGETPAAPLVQGADGFFYAVAAHGGDFTASAPDGRGTAFRMDASGNVTTLHTFKGPEGAVPVSLIQGRDGFFYGTATYGGDEAISSLQPGNGTLFRMDAAGVVTVLYVFPYSIGGGSSQPGPIVQGADGALYGGALGAYGTSAIGIQASDGFFYGTTEQGGYGGEIFRMDAAGKFTVIHRFDSYFSDGGRPRSGLIEGRDGFLLRDDSERRPAGHREPLWGCLPHGQGRHRHGLAHVHGA